MMVENSYDFGCILNHLSKAKRLRTEENQKRRAANTKKNEIVQVVSNNKYITITNHSNQYNITTATNISPYPTGWFW